MKKILYVILAVLLVAAFCTGSAAAFRDASSTVTPSGALNPGDPVTAVVKLTIPGSSGCSLQLTSPLSNVVWKVDVIRGGVTITSTGGSKSPFSLGSMFVGIYDEDIQLEITMTGKAGQNLAGSTFKAVTIIETGSKMGGETTYSTPEQTVYDPAVISKTISAKRNEIATIKDEAAFYNMFGIDVNATNEQVASAESYFRNAETYLASSNLNAANNALTQGETAVNNAGLGLAKLALDKISSDMSAIDADIRELKEKNWSNEVAILTSELGSLSNSYSLLNAEVSKGTVQDCRTALQDAENILAEANGYVTKANSAPDFLKYWWVLLIVLGVAAVVVGVVFILKRRGGGWDELG